MVRGAFVKDYTGIIGCGIVIFFSGFPALFILGARSSLTDVSNLKKAEALVWDIIGAYFGVRYPSFSGARSCPISEAHPLAATPVPLSLLCV